MIEYAFKLAHGSSYLGAVVMLLAISARIGWSQTMVPNGLVAYWAFEERAGTVAADSSASENFATLRDGATWSGGRVGTGSLALDGVNDRATVSRASFDGSGDMTIAAWVKKVSDAKAAFILDMQVGNTHVAFQIEQRNNANRVCLGNGTNGIVCTGPGSISPFLGQWVHLAVTRPRGGSGTRIHINGVEAIAGNAGADIAGATMWAIGGAADNATARSFNGLIDDLRVYNRILPATELLQLASVTSPLPTLGSASSSDATQPTVAITFPSNGATITSTVNVTASASDNVAVTKVEFYVDNVLRATELSAPYTYSWPATQWPSGTHVLTAKAYDAAGNTRTSAPVSVAVNLASAPTPPPPSTSPPTSSTGRVFYVSPSGNDGYPGTLQQPWRTIQKAVNTMSAGDTTLVRGGTYNKFVPIGYSAGNGYDGSAAKNGSASAPITLKAYPGETVTWTNDLGIALEHWSMGRLKFIDIRGRSYWQIEGFKFSHTESPRTSMWWYYGIYVQGTKAAPAAGIVIRGNTFNGNRVDRPGGTVIDLRYTDRAVVEGNLFTMWSNTTVSSSGVGAIVLETEWRNDAASAVPNRNTIIRNNTFEGIGGDGVQIGPWAGYNTLIESNVFKTRYSEFPNNTFENGIDVKKSSFTTIRGNTIWGYRKKTTKDPYGAAILVHLMAEDVMIDGNTIYDNSTGIAAAKGNPDSALPTPSWYSGTKSLSRITMTRNVIFNTNTQSQAGGGAGPGVGVFANGINGLKIYHNVIAFSADTAIKMDQNTSAALQNNILYNARVGVLDEGASGQTTIGVNLCHGISVPLVYRLPNGSMTSLSLTDVQYGATSASIRAGDPLFVNPSTSSGADYRVKSGSPAIDKGLRLVGFNDQFVGSAPDIGAREFGIQ